MKRHWFPTLASVFLGILLLAVFAVRGIPYFFDTELPEPAGSGFGSETVRARVETVIETGTIDMDGVSQLYQVLRVGILEGEYAGIPIEVEYGRTRLLPDNRPFAPGDEIFVVLGLRPDNRLVAYYADAVRWQPLALLGALFVAAILAISRWKGLRALLSLVFSLLVIIGYIIPHILQGEDPVRVSIIGSGILLAVSLYLTYGWTLKTHAAVLSMLIVLVITGSLAWLFIWMTRLSGYGDENALFLVQVPGIQINLRGLLLGGMIIGALGVLDDLVTTQASAVFELHGANPSLGLRLLSARALRIGQDHVAATVNTLVLAYAGASLPMLLLFTMMRGNLAYLINYETVAHEIVRTLVGSLGLVVAVPLSTLTAALLALYGDRLGVLRPLLGKTGSHDEHGHAHG
jgi:uncharacterized membrane protein